MERVRSRHGLLLFDNSLKGQRAGDAPFLRCIDHTKAFDQATETVSKVLPKIGCQHKLQILPQRHDHNIAVPCQLLEPFDIDRSVKQRALRSRCNGLWAFLCSAFGKCIRYNNIMVLPAYPIKRQAINPRPPQNQEHVGEDQIHAVCC